MAADQDNTSNQIHNNTIRGLSRLKRYLKSILPSASKKTPKRCQSPSSNRTSSKTAHQISSHSLYGGPSESHIGLPRKQNDSIYSVDARFETGGKKQKLLPNTHVHLLSSALENQISHSQAGTPPCVHGSSDNFAIGCNGTSPYDLGDIALSSTMSDLNRRRLNSIKATDAQSVGTSGQCYPAGNSNATPHNSSTQGLRKESQPRGYATSVASVTSVPQPWLDQNFSLRAPQPGGESNTGLPTVCPSSRAIVRRDV
jgi:hypothetical protein